MSPPLEPHPDKENNISSNMGVDDEINLLSSPKQQQQSNDQAMDLFLNQVAEYNAHFDHHPSASTSSMGVDPTQVLAQHEVKIKQEEKKQDIVSNNKKGKQKQKEHSSLLQVFTNPLLHAIPILARNMLNFEDFLAQTSLPGQSLLGPGEIMEDMNVASPQPPKSDSPWHVRVLGLPHTGAKSRVETQIKICLQLVDTAGELANNWAHLKLPEHLVAKDKLKRKNQAKTTASFSTIADEKQSFIESQVLTLEAAVVCDGTPDNEIIMCTSCVHRERKRLKRKRDNKVARAVNKEGGAAKLAALFANDLPDLNDEKIMAEERRRILLFNCNEYVEFNNGEATLPTRVTCYCRHHSEKTGFRILFTVRDSNNHIIANGRSPPIMITDDHKSSKIQLNNQKKRTREQSTDIDQPTTTKRKMAETDSAMSSPIASTPVTPSSQIDESNNIPDSPPPAALNVVNTQHPLTESTTTSSFISQENHHVNELFDFLNSHQLDLLSHQPPPPPASNNNTHIDHTNNNNYNNNNIPLPLIHPNHQQQQILDQFNLNNNNNNNMMMSRNRRATVIGTTTPPTSMNNNNGWQQQQQQQSNVYSKLQERNNALDNKTNLPRLHRLIPSEGPIYGGSEVTVLGSNFYEGLTCLFGENPAIPTHCWSSNTLLCILPPAASAGPVVVSFKEHPLMLEGQDVVLFTYFDESDRALMELALQVVGLKTMGKVEDARQIAMRIVQGDNNSSQQKQTPSNINGFRYQLSPLAATAVYDNAKKFFLSRLQQHIMSTLLAISTIENKHSDYLALTNHNQHSLLHLATLCGHVELVNLLVNKLGVQVNQVDLNGFTALHFASWTGQLAIVQLLIPKSNLKLTNKVGKTAERLAIESGHKPVVALFQSLHCLKPKKKTIVRIPLTDFIPTEAVQEIANTVLPTRITNLLSNLYQLSAKTKSAQRIAHSAGQVYHFMLDPF